MSELKPKVAIVVQRYGLDVSGGAELFARWLAEHLIEYVNVEIITTCAQDYLTWENHYSAGFDTVNDVPVHRFFVEKKRNSASFIKKTVIFQEDHSFKDAVDWIWEQGPISPDLLKFIQDNQHNYDIFIFMNFEYATTYLGIQLVAEKSILIPAAHDHPYMYLPMFRPIFHMPAGIAYLTNAEKNLVNKATNNTYKFDDTIAVGIDVPSNINASRIYEKYNLPKEFLLYVGRVELGKNIDELFAYYSAYAERYSNAPPLVIIGKVGDVGVPQHPNIIHLGRVSEQDKFDALKAAKILLMPSLYESLSMVLLESWLVGTPVIVNGLCDVTTDQAISSNGGLYYYSFEEFCETIQLLLNDDMINTRLGEQGKRFTQDTYNWNTVMAKYLRMIKTIMQQTAENLSLAP